MELKDLVADVEQLATVRGGNSIRQNSRNAGVSSNVRVAGHVFNGSPVTVDSLVAQQNLTTQHAAIADVRTHELGLSFDQSVLSFGGFGRMFD